MFLVVLFLHSADFLYFLQFGLQILYLVCVTLHHSLLLLVEVFLDYLLLPLLDVLVSLYLIHQTLNLLVLLRDLILKGVNFDKAFLSLQFTPHVSNLPFVHVNLLVGVL